MSKLFRFKIQSRKFSSVFKKDVWTKEGVVNSPCKDIVIPKTTLDDYVWRSLDKWPTKVAMICGITNRSYKYEELYKHSRKFGANLRKKFKLQNGDAVAVVMRNAPEYPIVVLGILAAGGVATTFNPVYTANEVHKQIILSEAKLIIADSDVVPTMKEALKLCKKDLPIITVDVDEQLPHGTVSYKELVLDEHVDLNVLKEVRREFDDVSLLPYSSGTTGLPKGAELTNFNFVANCEQQNAELRHYSYTTVMYLGSHPDATPKHLEQVRTAICGAAPLPPADLKKFLEKAPKDVFFCQGYGMTETSPLVCVGSKSEVNYDAVGYSLPNIQLRVVDDDLRNLGPDEVGELLIKGPNVMKGYKNNPKANSEVFIEGGWFRSGDLAKINKHGLITISDRLKELIKVNGFQVPPAELEYILKDHPNVSDAAVIGIPDPSSGERPKAFIVLKEGAKESSENIAQFVNEKVAPYKKIRDVVFLDSIPKNPSGKILRKELRKLYC